MKKGLEIVLLGFRTSRILIETGLRLNLFLDLSSNFFQFEIAWILQFGLKLQYKHMPI